MVDMLKVRIWKTMDILKLINNDRKLVLVFCHFAQVKLDHLEKLLYNLDLKNYNPRSIEFIFLFVKCYYVRSPYETILMWQ